MKKALISPNEAASTGLRIAEVVDVGSEFEVANPLYWIDCQDDVTSVGYFYNPTAQACEVIPVPVPDAAANEAMAKEILSNTDWTQLPSISNPQESTPYLTNAPEFATYRNFVRSIAINPVAGVIDWGTEPTPVWSGS